MLENLKKQLIGVFKVLDESVILELNSSKHSKQKELEDMLNDVSSCSPNIQVEQSKIESNIPSFKVRSKNKEISFSGIPGGHEFSSLILAILNINDKGKFPDKGIINRIKNLKGSLSLKTYISLSCENCPDVVQNFNLISIINENIKHEMIDGGLVHDEISQLGIQGVPAVVVDDKIVLSGKQSLNSLLDYLESNLGNKNQNQFLGEYEVVIIGGGPAGVSSAIYTARKGLKTAIIADNIGGQVKETKGIENLISVPYIEGNQLSAQLENHLKEYDIDILEHRLVTNIKEDDIYKINLKSGEILSSKSIIIATGSKWRELNIKGEKEFLGKGVAFCPHCDGPFYKNKDVVVVGGGNSGIEAAIDLSSIVKSVKVLEFADELKADQVLIDKMNTIDNISYETNAMTSEFIGNDKLTQVMYKNRETNEEVKLNVDGVFIQIGLSPNSSFIKDLIDTNEYGEIIIDEKCKTSKKGIFAAGDVTTVPYKQIVISMGEGAKAGLSAFEYLKF